MEDERKVKTEERVGTASRERPWKSDYKMADFRVDDKKPVLERVGPMTKGKEVKA
jgi:hypothetical protein